MTPDFDKSGNGLLPVIIQDDTSLQVLMLGYMNAAAYSKTLQESKVTFFSRSKNRLWTKGETSGNFLYVQRISLDCDNDTLLITVNAAGPACHTGAAACFDIKQEQGFLYTLEKTIHQRIDKDVPDSYTNKLFKLGINKVAQKVGEETVELIIESKDDHIGLFKNEAADLLYHLLILLKSKDVQLSDIESVLKERNR